MVAAVLFDSKSGVYRWARAPQARSLTRVASRPIYLSMRNVGLGALLAVGFLGCVGCGATEWHEEDTYRWRELRVPRRGSVGFTQLPASKTGIEFINSIGVEQFLENQNLLMGSGVTLGDVDGDGLVDVYLARTDGPNALYRNLGDWRFRDITDDAGVAAPDRFSTGAVLGDIEGDGDLDLLVTALGGPNALFQNDGTGVFTEITEEAGLQSNSASATSTLADVDGDGDLDLYIANYKVLNAVDAFEPGEMSGYVEELDSSGVAPPKLQTHFRFRKENGEWVRSERAEADGFYLNDGTGRFERVAFTAGRFRDEEGNPLTREPDYFGLAARFYDVDQDGDPDLYVCNDFESPDHFWINDGTGTFHAAPHLALRSTGHASMAVDFGDVDRDGHVDFYVVDMLARDLPGRKMRGLAHGDLMKSVGEVSNRPQMQRNTLFANRGDGTYAQIADLAGVEASDWSWSTVFLDVDLDGYEDVLVGNGYTWDVYNWDMNYQHRTWSNANNWREIRLLYPDLHQKNVVFRNNGDLTFEDVGSTWGFGAEDDISHGVATGDLDGDGDLDVIVNRLDAVAGVFRNDVNEKRVAVRLIGQAPNTQAIGAKIRVRGGPVVEQQKEVTLGGLYLSSSDPLYAFATGDTDSLTIVVDWRSGERTVVQAKPNTLYEIREPAFSESSSAGSDAESAEAPEGASFFVDVSNELDHIHTDALFDDFDRQPLLANKLSQLGPGVSWYDVEGDGDEDLLLPTGRGGRLAYYQNERGTFRKVALRMPAAEHDQTTVLAQPDGEGGTVLLIGQATYEAMTPDEAGGTPSVVKLTMRSDRSTLSPALLGNTSSVGPLAQADVDGDGDLDLFVGGRVIPMAYPVAASSRLLLNQAGSFELDAGNGQTFSQVGLVSAAVFSDLDGDGDPDLVLALEWGPLKLFVNENGQFIDATDQRGLGQHLSWWNGVATGDLDGDGRLDIVATSWGRNTKYRATPAQPLLVYFSDFDRSGVLDMIYAQHDDVVGGITPLLENPVRMAREIPYTRNRWRNARAYAYATARDILGLQLAEASQLEAKSLEHVVFFNRSTTFEAVPLPLEAQFAPAFYAGVADFDGDGHEDVFLSQNFFATGKESPRYDAGRGLWLQGDGQGGLTPVSGQISGVMVYGEQRGAALADYDGDGRVDLAVSQNGAETKLYRNVGAKPGLRVRLVGPPDNPFVIGAQLRLVYPARRGPVREVQAGSGYWSSNGALQVLGNPDEATGLWVRWPGGEETEVSLEPGQLEITLEMAGENRS